MSRRINQWCAHFGSVSICQGIRTRNQAATLAWEWYESTSRKQRETILRNDELDNVRERIRDAAVLIRQYANGRDVSALAGGIADFAETVRP